MSGVALVVAGTALAAFVVLAVLRPRVSLVSLVVLDVSNINAVIAEHIGTSPYKPQLALAVVVLLVLACRRQFRFAWSPVLLGSMVLTAGFCLSFVNAADPATSQELLAARTRDLFYFLVVFGLILSTRSVVVVAKASVAILAALAALTVIHEYVLHNTGDLLGLSRVPLVQEGGALTSRHAGTSSDVNFWGRLLILFAPLGMSFLAISKSWRTRLLWTGCTLSLLIGVYLTQSRGGFIAVFIGGVGWLALAGGRYRKAILFLPVALIVIVPLSGIGSRLLTLTSSSGASVDPSVFTRKRLQLDAWHMFLDRPVFGHGIGSYGALFSSYDRASNAYQPVDIVVAAHNFYLEQAADGGIVLMLAWMIFVGTVLFVALRTLSISRTAADPALRFVAVGIIGGMAGWAVASLFLHLSDYRALLLLAAIAAALDVRARQSAVPRVAPPAPVKTARGPVAALSLIGVFLVATGGLLAVALNSRPSYVNTATLAVVPLSANISGSTAYQVDVVSRGVIVPTLTEILNQSVTESDRDDISPLRRLKPAKVTVTQSRLGGSIVVTVIGPTAQAAADQGAAAVSRSKVQVAELGSSYKLSGEMGGPRFNPGIPRWVALPLAVLMVLAFVLFVPRRRSLTRGGLAWRPFVMSRQRGSS